MVLIQNVLQRGLIFLVDDDEHLTSFVAQLLRQKGWAVSCFASGEACLAAMQESNPSCVLLDLNMPGLSGEHTLERITTLYRHLPVIVLTMERDVELVVNILRRGAYDFLAKPVEPAKLFSSVSRAIEKYTLAMRVSQLEREHESNGFPGLIGRSAKMQALARQIERVAATDVTVHIHGESGTGKELVARALHENSGRQQKPFLALNCAALAESLQESELFGHEKGAFTGAVARKEGRFEAVSGGTLFLDEVAELSLGAQAKLLRVLQERKVQRVGGHQEVSVDFRLLTATHRDLSAAVRKGTFREDLYFRIVVYELEMPALRERAGDVLTLAEHFVATHGPRLIGKAPCFAIEALESLSRYSWPGNVRELENAVQRALVSCNGEVITLDDLPRRTTLAEAPGSPPLEARASQATPPTSPPAPVDVSPPRPSAPAAARLLMAPPFEGPGPEQQTLVAHERSQIVAALERCKGNRSLAAQQLGIGRTTLYRKLREYGLELP